MRIGTAAEFIERARARGESRRRLDGPVLPQVVRLFVERPGPVTRAALAHALPAMPAVELERALAQLDAADHLFLEDGAVTLAYPFAAGPNAFGVTLRGGRERYGCCAVDALGIAPMLGERIEVRSRCHHSHTPLAFAVDPVGPEQAAHGVMVWVGERDPDARRVCTTL